MVNQTARTSWRPVTTLNCVLALRMGRAQRGWPKLVMISVNTWETYDTSIIFNIWPWIWPKSIAKYGQIIIIKLVETDPSPKLSRSTQGQNHLRMLTSLLWCNWSSEEMFKYRSEAQFCWVWSHFCRYHPQFLQVECWTAMPQGISVHHCPRHRLRLPIGVLFPQPAPAWVWSSDQEGDENSAVLAEIVIVWCITTCWLKLIIIIFWGNPPFKGKREHVFFPWRVVF